MSPGPVVVGIDAGGSGTRAELRCGGCRIRRGLGGPGNPVSVGEAELERSLAEATRGCTDPDAVVASVSGGGGGPGRERFERVLERRFPAARRRVLADYEVARQASGVGSVAVIAGTGSVVAGSGRKGETVISGGEGFPRGDRGSAARLGAAWAGIDPPRGAATPGGAAGWAEVGPELTAAAERGEERAGALLGYEMAALASVVGEHLREVERGGRGEPVRIELFGGVFGSAAARATFEAALAAAGIRARTVRASASPLAIASQLAEELVR